MGRRALNSLLVITVLIALVGCVMGPAADPTPIRPASPVTQPEVQEASPAPSRSAPDAPTATADLAASSSQETETPLAPDGSQAGPDVLPTPVADPFDLLSQESLLSYVEDLTAVQPYSGWRNSGSTGEAEALDYAAERLGELEYLRNLGVELERATFHIFLATELRETRLLLTIDDQEVEVPADGLLGPRDDIAQARRFDSDGALNDAEPDPVVVEGPVIVVRDADEIGALRPQDVQGRVVLLDYAVVDRSVMRTEDAVAAAWELVEKQPAGLVLITSFSNREGVSHGAFVGDLSAFNWVEADPVPPILYVRLEDMTPAGIEGWDDLEQIAAARLTWDADIFSPGTSGNLVAHIPGADGSQAMILGAHIDSPNAPGAMDDGSGSAILLEVARVLDAAQVQPPIDLYLVWFGSEEVGLYGAFHFVATHQELLDRTRAMLQIDALTHPLDGLDAELRLVTWPYGRLGDPRMVWPETLAEVAAHQGVNPVPYAAYYVYSDNSPFGGFDVPQADLIYEPVVEPNASIHYSGHMHDPYDTVDLAREMGDVFEQMARVALSAALNVGQEATSLRVTPRPDRRALFVASHTEPGHMTPAGFTEMGMALAMEGFHVNLIPYGQTVTTADLADADLVAVLPVLDLPPSEGDPTPYDEAWTEEEVETLEAYAAGGGLLVLTNSRQRLKYGTQGLDGNEDWADANALASRFGVSYQEGAVTGHEAGTEGVHPLVKGLSALEIGEGNGVPFRLADEAAGQVLARAEGEPVLTLLDYGDAGGQVLVLADVAMLSAGWSEPRNLPFWQNLGRYARSR